MINLIYKRFNVLNFDIHLEIEFFNKNFHFTPLFPLNMYNIKKEKKN